MAAVRESVLDAATPRSAMTRRSGRAAPDRRHTPRWSARSRAWWRWRWRPVVTSDGQYTVVQAVMSVLVKWPVSVWRKHEFMTEPPTVAPLGVPAIRIAPTLDAPSLLAAPPQLMARLKKSEWRMPRVWPSSWVITCATVFTLKPLCRPLPMLIALNGRPPDGKPETPPVPVVIRAVIVALQPVVLPLVRVMRNRR